MTSQRKTLWGRAAQALGKFWAGMVLLSDDRRQPASRTTPWTDYPRFPPY